MYSTCLFCNANLGTNEVIESFPIGRRLAFDAANGRLVGRVSKVRAVEPVAARGALGGDRGVRGRYRDTRLRVSTDNIGLARVAEGLELVRIGAALRPEFAAWRYGDQFGRRRRRQMVRVGLGVGIVGGAIAGGVALGVSAGVGFGSGGWWIWRGIYAGFRRIAYGSPDAIVARIPYDDKQQQPRVLSVRRRDLDDVRLGSAPNGGLLLALPLRGDTVYLSAVRTRNAARATCCRPSTGGRRAARRRERGAPHRRLAEVGVRVRARDRTTRR